MSEPIPLGQIAFGAYVESVDGTAVSGEPIPEWAALTERVQQAWIAAGAAAVRVALEAGIVRAITEIDGDEYAEDH